MKTTSGLLRQFLSPLALLFGIFVLVTAACALPAGAAPTAAPTIMPTGPVVTATGSGPIATAAPTEIPPAATQPAAQPTTPASQPQPASPTRPPAATKPPAQLSEVTIYWVAVGDNGLTGIKVGCGDSLVPVKQPIEPTSGVIRAALTRLFSFKDQHIGQSGLYNALWQSNLSVGSARVDNGVATVDLVGQIQLGGECDTPRFKGQIEQTILAQPGVKSAVVTINGKPIDQVLSLK